MSNIHQELPAAFNTGAAYSPHGQRIAVWIRKSAVSGTDICCLVDFDRQIHCHFPVRVCSAIAMPVDLCLHALHMYRWGQYDLGCSMPERLEVHAQTRAVLCAGYEAFTRLPGVQVISDMATPLLRPA